MSNDFLYPKEAVEKAYENGRQQSLKERSNAEPVAWMDDEGGFYAKEDYEVCKQYDLNKKYPLIPLYTTPQTKPLSDEEIENLWYDPRFIGDPVAFGKAILRTLENKPLQTDEEICNKCDALTEKALSKKSNRRKDIGK